MIKKLTRENAAEYKKLRLLALATDPDAYFAVYETEASRDESAIASEIAAHSAPYGYTGWFADDGVLHAYVQIAPSYGKKTAHTADVFNLYVRPEFRSRGIAYELMQHILLELASQKTLEILWLSVMDQNNAAIAFYTKLGFVTYGKKVHAIKQGDKYRDELLMRYDFQR